MELAEARAGGADSNADLQASALLAVRGLTIRFGGVIALGIGRIYLLRRR